MPRRSILLACLFGGTPLFATGCACDRPLFPRLRCLFACRPAFDAPVAPLQQPAFAPPPLPSYSAPMAAAPGYGQPPCVGCGDGGVAGRYAPPGALAGLPMTNGLPPGAIPIGPLGGVPMPGPQMSEPQAQFPTKGGPGAYTLTGAPTLLPPPVAAPLR